MFYEIYHPKNLPEKYLVWWSDEVKLGTITCPANPGHQRSPPGRLTDLTVIIPTGESLKSDFIWTWYSEPLINERVVKIFKDTGFTGYELKPVTIKEVKLSKPSKIPKYWELVVTGKGGDAHPDSGIYLKETCEACGLKVYSAYENGIIVDENNWDGSDFFTVTGYPKHILVTERVKDAIGKNKITNVELTPSNELRWPEGVIKP